MSDDIPSRRSRRDAAPETPPRGGVLAAIRAHRTTWVVSALVVAFVALGTGAVFTGIAVASGDQPPPVVEPGETPAPRPVPASVAPATALKTCSVSSTAADPHLEELYGIVRTVGEDPEVLWHMRGDEAHRIGGVLSTFTAAAAIAALGPGHRITTSVIEGPVPGSIVLVGRGDATLSTLPPGVDSVYEGAPKLTALAEQVIATYAARHPEQPITQVLLDATYWNPADRWHESWSRDQQTGGHQSEVTALQVDGDRADPQERVSPRSSDPIGRAGEAFLQALRDADPTGEVVAAEASTTVGSVPGSAPMLGEVESQTVAVLVEQMLRLGDNTLAEMLARIVSVRSGLGGSAVSLDSAISSALRTFDVDTSGLSIIDGSGLSRLNAASAKDVAAFMALVQSGRNGLDIVRDALAVSGKSGALASRFAGDNADAEGAVHALASRASGVHSLAGFLDAEDGTRLAFSFSVVGDHAAADARRALDTLTTAVYRCGQNLTDI